MVIIEDGFQMEGMKTGNIDDMKQIHVRARKVLQHEAGDSLWAGGSGRRS